MFKKVHTIVLVAAIALCGCQKDSLKTASGAFNGRVTAKIENGASLNSIISTVMVVNGPYIENNTLKGVYVGESDFKNGGFDIELPANGFANGYMSIKKFFEDCLDVHEDLEYSDANVQVEDVDFLAFDADDYLRGYFIYGSSAKEEGRTTGFFVYSKEDVTVTGGKNISVSLKAGWNRLCHSATSVTTKAPSGMKWFFLEME